MDKKEYIKSLNNVKLVLGNGYDLHCGLKCSYKDYFEYNKEKLNNFFNWNSRAYFKSIHDFVLDIDKSLFDTLYKAQEYNIWDIFFYLKSSNNNDYDHTYRNWSDVETLINDSLIKDEYKLNWWSIYRCLSYISNNGTFKESYQQYPSILLMVAFIMFKNQTLNVEKEDDYFEYVLDELKSFEKQFGLYIQRQRWYIDKFGLEHNNYWFDKYSSMTMEYLCNVSNLVAIDTFNYDNVGINALNHKIRFINGDCSFPIFGIDSNIVSSDIRYPFTKTNRRMELDMISKTSSIEMHFDNVIVYGHSLSKNDYSYFFPLLDKLQMTDNTSDKVIVFSFSIWDKNKKLNIMNDIRRAVFDLFDNYAKYKGILEPYRLLDSLTANRRVIIYEIPDLEITNEYFEE